MRNLILTVFLILCFIKVDGQLLEANHTISFTAGYGSLNGHSDNLFFTSDINQSSLNLDMSYTRKVIKWLSAGLILNYTGFLEPSVSTSFVEVVSDSEAIFSMGPQLSFHTPHRVSGMWNWIKFALAVAPKYSYYSGRRMLIIDNEIVPLRNTVVVEPVLKMNEAISGFGFQISPHISYRISQRIGLRLGYSFNALRVYSGYNNENLFINTFQGGVIVKLGFPKQVFN